jgi:ribosome-associated protein
MEGEDTGEWVLVDLGDMIVHIMQPAIRQYYRLEEIWGDKPVKLGAAKRKSTAEAAEVAAPKAVSKHLAATQAAPEVKPVRERKATTTAKKAAPGTAEAKPAAKKRIPAGTTVRVAVPKAAAADAAAAKAAKAAAGPKRATKAAAEAPAPAAAGAAAPAAKKVIRRIKKSED